jgi:hypothetical protein
LYSTDPDRAGAWSLESQSWQAGIKKEHRHEGTKGHESTRKDLQRHFVVVFRILGHKKHEFHY